MSPSNTPTEANSPTVRPSVSVCLDAYNGERFIEAQLRSILEQLAEGDEVVVVDDASTDDTIQRVLDLKSDKIRLIQHHRNQGVSRSFEEAVRNASNTIIFLSDQDDLWVPDKVTVMLREFIEHPSVTLVASDAALIDADGKFLSSSYFQGRGRFRPGLFANLIRNRYGGCTMAFRKSILPEVLPFPHKYDVLHDIWIGVQNSLSNGKAVFINQPLIWNRRHAGTATGMGNATGIKRLSIWRKLRTRLHLLLALSEFELRRRF